MTDITVPSLGESVTEATVAKWLKKVGDTVKADEPVAELETDKVTLEVNAPADGVISQITVKEGDTVAKGAILGTIGAQGSVVAAEAPVAPTPAPVIEPKTQAVSAEKLAPSVTKMVAENNLDTNNIAGTGKDGRLTKGDVLNHLAQPTATPVGNVVTTNNQAREERVKMTRLRQVIAARLKEAQNTAAMLTTFNEVDMSAIMDLRAVYKDQFEKRHKTKLGFMSFFVKAAIAALKEFPAVNGEIDGQDIVYKNYYDIGVAVSTPQGLIVPVLRDADQKSLAQIESGIVDLGARARDGKLGMNEMSGGTFTITNGGTFGSLLSTPILNTPQVGILGMHKIQQRAMVMKDGSIQARPMMYLALSYDHRIIDGREAVSFLVKIKDLLEDPQRLILDV
jgi:2-oxoglutarate dehydrogenase E2 component (dihydrolipoamide succinyltransferase)